VVGNRRRREINHRNDVLEVFSKNEGGQREGEYKKLRCKKKKTKGLAGEEELVLRLMETVVLGDGESGSG